MKVYPVKYVAYDEAEELVCKVEAIDEAVAEVTICTAVTVDSWKEISEEVLKCLIEMKLGEI